MTITAASSQGRILLAMRAGRIEASQLREAFPTIASGTLTILLAKKLIEKKDGL